MAETNRTAAKTAAAKDSKAKADAEVRAEAKAEAHQEPTPAQEKANEKAVEEARTESDERAAAVSAPSAEAAIPVDDNAIAQPPVPQHATVDDGAGVERIVLPEYSDGWTPAPVDPHPSQVKAAEEREARFKKERDQRLEALKKASS